MSSESEAGSPGISHLHAHFGTNSAMVAMLCERLGGVTYSLTIHGSEEFDRPEALALGEKVRHAEFVATISSFCRSQVYRWASPEDWGKIHIVRCGLHPEYFTAELPPIPATPKLVSVGRLSKEKAQVLMVRAVHLLAQRGIKVELVFAGDGPVRPEIEEMARRCGLEDSIHITGWVDSEQVRSHLLDARALILASFAEGVPIVIMESFALGRPVISSFVGGVPELVEDKVSGWLVPPGDVDKLADAMQQAVSASPERLTAMGEHGRKHTLEMHDVTKEAEKLKQLFVELFANGADRGT